MVESFSLKQRVPIFIITRVGDFSVAQDQLAQVLPRLFAQVKLRSHILLYSAGDGGAEGVPSVDDHYVASSLGCSSHGEDAMGDVLRSAH